MKSKLASGSSSSSSDVLSVLRQQAKLLLLPADKRRAVATLPQIEQLLRLKNGTLLHLAERSMKKVRLTIYAMTKNILAHKKIIYQVKFYKYVIHLLRLYLSWCAVEGTER